MSPGATADRVYETLKRQIMIGALGPGTRLDPARLASDLNASATPVRDALHQLLGERLIEARSHAGFWVRIETETDLRALYEWNADLLLAILRKAARSSAPNEVPAPPGAADVATASALLFVSMAAATGNLEYHYAMAQACNRLHAARRAEQRLLGDTRYELGAMADAWRDQARSDLARLITAYHRRRLARVPAIAAMLRPAPDPRIA